MHKLSLLTLLLLTAGAASAQQQPAQVQVNPLFSKPLAEHPGKEAVVIEVVYPPGGGDPVHRHNAHGVVYVLEGSIVMGVRGGEPVTLTPGQIFYEGPDDLHTVGHNASRSEPARFLVFLLKQQDEPILTPEQ
ncbi:cupin domain-containing protein [Stutzerimonas stutzeri]|uniref:cupin domain-containing protein n=1 Tax=Stutzerimonas sp. S1 TaxID=3030652 RepID=UPI002225750A|nr:cupin domain-containing protein [Stutzerimonas sp. S1]MCW3150407.1 cupin domain-containing protein [Stutzerimonas sp. S1]